MFPWGVAEVRDLGLEQVLLDAGGGYATTLVIADELQPAGVDPLSLPLEGVAPGAPGQLNVGHPQACAALADETGSYRDDARATYLLAYVTYYLGDPVEAERLAAKAAEWLDRTADRYFQIQNSLLLSRMALTRDDLDESERWARVALPLAQELGGWLLVEACRHLTEALVLRGDTEEAGRTADVAEARISAARVMLLVGERAIGERLLRKAREDAEGTEAHRIVEVVDELLTRTREGAGSADPLAT